MLMDGLLFHVPRLFPETTKFDGRYQGFFEKYS
jgi:hypothetical protein